MFFLLWKEAIILLSWYKGYLELIYRCLLDDIYTKLTCMRILYEEITCVYRKTHVTIV